MYFSDNNTYNDIREKSLMQWLDDMEKRLQKILDEFRLDVYKDGEKNMVGRTSKESATVALSAARKFVSDFPNTTNLYVFGETGTGKTHLACCIATEVINKGYSTIFIKSADFINLCYQKFKDDEKMQCMKR